MLKRAFVFVGMVAVLLTGIFPAGDVCALAAAADHACCAEPDPEETTSSCCSSTEAPAEPFLDCTCAHHPSTPVTAVGTPSSVSPGDDGQSVSETGSVDLAGSTDSRPRVAEHRARSHPPPPTYLLNCANLN